MAYEKDVESVDAIIRAIYDVISGPAGPKDWDRERFIMHPRARMMRGLPPGDRSGAPPTPELAIFDTEQFIAFATPKLSTEDFYEYETGREVFPFGRMAQVVSAYASAKSLDEEPYARGVNSIQLWHDAGRWWVLTVMWDWAGDGNPIPGHLRQKS
jgi:Zn-dependent protease with chaperone function